MIIVLIKRFSQHFYWSSQRTKLDLLLRISCFLNQVLVDQVILLVPDDQSQPTQLLVAYLDQPRLLFLGLMITHFRASNHLRPYDFLIIHFSYFRHALLCLLLLPIFLYFLIPLLTSFLFFLVLLPSFLPLLLFQLHSTPKNFK